MNRYHMCRRLCQWKLKPGFLSALPLLIILMLLGGIARAETAGLDPKETFLQFWDAYMNGETEAVKPLIKHELAESLTPEDLKYRTYYPQLVEVVEVDMANDGIAKLTLRGTYVHPYDERTMGSLERNRRQFGGLEMSAQKWDDIRQRLPVSARERIETIIAEDGLSEVWLLSIPGRALVVKQDGVWRVDIYHFDDKVMYQTPPQRIFLKEAEPPLENSAAEVPVAEGP